MTKKTISYFIGILLCSTSLIGCFHKQEKNCAETFYASGAIKSKKYFWKEGVFVDTAYYYYENGNPSSIEVLNDSGVLNGVSKMFYENGNLYQKINYRNGINEGFVYEYTNSGNLHSKVFYLNNTQIGDCFWYYDDKPQFISQYSFYDFEGHNLNLITYDSITSKPIKNLYQDIFIDFTNLENRVGRDSFDIQLLISNPPKCRSTVRIDCFSKNGILIKSDSITGIPYYFTKEQLSDSLYGITFLGNQYDSSTQTTYKQFSSKSTRLGSHTKAV